MTEEYIVDISKPPIFPPCRTFKYGWFRGEYETKESKQKTNDWNRYIKEYRKAIQNKTNTDGDMIDGSGI
jgi:hypothetical protein